MGFGVLRKVVSAVVNRVKYGKQIGKVSQAGYKCYGKTNKAGQQVYTLFDKNGKLVSTKKMVNNGGRKDFYTCDAKGNMLVHSSTYTEKLSFGFASDNQFAKKIINDRERYNKMGQTIDKRRMMFAPSTTKQQATVFSNINGVQSKTYLNTKTGQKHTITCVEK